MISVPARRRRRWKNRQGNGAIPLRGVLVSLLLLPALRLPAPPRTDTPSGTQEALDALPAALSRRLDQLRAEAGSGPIPRSEGLDEMACQRAAEIAALPEAHRQLAGPIPIGEFLARRNFGPYRRVGEHLDLKKGFRDTLATFANTWLNSPQDRVLAVDPDMESVGIGLASADDGWVVLVALFLQPESSIRRDPAALEQQTLRRVNEIRVMNGLDELLESPELSEVARAHSADMAREGFFDHVDPRGLAPADRVRRAGILHRAVAENIQSNDAVEAARVAVEQWMQSPGHRRNILTAGFRFTGMGVAVDETRTVYFTQLFLEPPRLQ